jgi:hypothetical protein
MSIIRLLFPIAALSLLGLASPANSQQRTTAIPTVTLTSHEIDPRDPLGGYQGGSWTPERLACAGGAPQPVDAPGALSTLSRAQCATRVTKSTLQGATVGLAIFSVYGLAVCLPKSVGGGDSSCTGTQATLLTVGGATIGGIIGLFSDACRRRDSK